MKKGNFKIIFFYVALIAAVFLAVYLLMGKEKPEEISYGEVVEYFDQDQVQKFTVDENYTLHMTVYLPVDGTIPRNESGAVVEGTPTKTITYDIPAYVDFVRQFSSYYQGDGANQSLDVASRVLPVPGGPTRSTP